MSKTENKLDQKRVDDAVVYIRHTLADTVYRGAIEIGDYVLEHFFNNDIEALRSHNPHKDASFRALAAKCGTELPISRSWLHSAIGVAVMRKLIPEAAADFKQLPLSHQAVLLPLRDPSKVERAAHKALTKRLTVRELKEVVVAEVAKNGENGDGDAKRGRPPTPLIVKTLEQAMKVFAHEDGRRTFTIAMVDELDDSQRCAAIHAAEDLASSLQRLIKQLKIYHD